MDGSAWMMMTAAMVAAGALAVGAAGSGERSAGPAGPRGGETAAFTPRMRMWTWLLGTLLAAPGAMAICYQLARLTELPLVIAFAPAALVASSLPVASVWLWTYLLAPVQCFIYGGLMARSALRGREWRTGAVILIVHVIFVAVAIGVTRGTISGQ